MMKTKYLLIVIGGLSVLAACHKHDNPDTGMTNNEIQMSPGKVTKALLGPSGLDASNTQVKVYDFLSGFSGILTVNGTQTDYDGSERFKYFGDIVTYPGSDDPWSFTSGRHYYWTRTGQHDFFGWIENDQNITGLNNTAFFGSGQPYLDEGTQELSIPSVTFTETTKQYDFVYSDITSRTAGDEGYTDVVPLSFKHLFTALSLTIRNSSTSNITINSVSIPDLPIKGSATIDYSGSTSPVAAEYSTPTKDGNKLFFDNKFSGGVTIPAKEEGVAAHEYDVFTGTAVAAGGPEYRLLWPVGRSVLSPTTLPDPVAADSLIVLDYNVGEANIVTRLKFPPVDLNAGAKNKVVMEFLDKKIRLVFIVQDWVEENVPRSFEMESVSSTQLKFDERTCIKGTKFTEPSGKQSIPITVTNAKTIIGDFNIYTPIGGKLKISASGHTQYFEINPTQVIINPEVDPRVELQIKPVNRTGTPRTEDSKIKLHFSVESNGREIEANSEINRDNYTIIWNRDV